MRPIRRRPASGPSCLLHSSHLYGNLSCFSFHCPKPAATIPVATEKSSMQKPNAPTLVAVAIGGAPEASFAL